MVIRDATRRRLVYVLESAAVPRRERDCPVSAVHRRFDQQPVEPHLSHEAFVISLEFISGPEPLSRPLVGVGQLAAAPAKRPRFAAAEIKCAAIGKPEIFERIEQACVAIGRDHRNVPRRRIAIVPPVLTATEDYARKGYWAEPPDCLGCPEVGISRPLS
jgi:hypothetical protein